MPIRLRVLLGSLLLTLTGLGCGAKSELTPFAVPPAEFFSRTNTIVLTPIGAPPGIEIPEPVMARFDSLIETQLRQAGLSIVPSDVYEEIWGRIIERAGGFFDSVTGDRDEVRFTTAREQLVRALRERFDADALLYPDIWVVEAPVSDGVAEWDGTSQSVSSFGSRFLNALLDALEPGSGNLRDDTVEALSLMVVIEDLDGVELYFNGGGIQVLREREDDEGIPRKELLADQKRNLKAVTIALDPLLRQGSEAGRRAKVAKSSRAIPHR